MNLWEFRFILLYIVVSFFLKNFIYKFEIFAFSSSQKLGTFSKILLSEAGIKFAATNCFAKYQKLKNYILAVNLILNKIKFLYLSAS
jgi:hypothetical protein